MKIDVLVVGAGPAGLAASQYAARAGWSTLVIDPMGPGGQLLYIDSIENYPGAEKISGIALSEELEKQCTAFGVTIDFLEAKAIEKKNGLFVIRTEVEDLEARAVILATGASHRHLGVPGETEYTGRGVSYCATCDGPFFKGKDVLVAGGGDTALTDAVYLSRLCRTVTVIHRRKEFRAQQSLQDALNTCPNITTVMEAEIASVDGDQKHVTGVTIKDGRKLPGDALFIFAGSVPNTKAFEGLVEMDGGYIRTDEAMRTSVDGIFAAGDVRDTTFRQIVTACGDGARAAHSADAYLRRN